jgi:hypothetical protein
MAGDRPWVRWFGVADGVGGWRKHGVDPSEFSHALMTAVCEVARMDGVNSNNISAARQPLGDCCEADGERPLGSVS